MFENGLIMRMVNDITSFFIRISISRSFRNFNDCYVDIEEAYDELAGLDRKRVRNLSIRELEEIISLEHQSSEERSVLFAELIYEDILTGKEEGDSAEIEHYFGLMRKCLHFFRIWCVKSNYSISSVRRDKITNLLAISDTIGATADEIENRLHLFMSIGAYDKAEDCLFDLVEVDSRFKKVAADFFERVSEVSDQELEKCNLTREEMKEDRRRMFA